MFFPSNDTIQSLTEKTKHLAQKCTHQIQQHLQHQQHYHHQQSDKTTTGNKKDKIDYGSDGNDDDTDIGCIGFGGGVRSGGGGGSGPDNVNKERKQSFGYFCACTGGSLRGLARKHKDGHATVKWYVKQPTWRLWGEEREMDAVFTVYLKKVRYHRPTPSANQDSDDEISHLEWETVRVRFVKAATLSRLVEALATDDGELESAFITVFLSTYRTFSNLKEVLSLLVKRYEKLNDMLSYEQYNNQGDGAGKIEKHKKTLESALHVWLDRYPEDWSESNLRLMLAFTSKRLPRSELHEKVLHRLDRIAYIPSNHNSIDMSWTHPYPDFAEQFAGLCLAPALRGPPSHLLYSYRFPHVPVKRFAEQLTRMDMKLFKRLIPHQCLGATWAKRDKNEAGTVVATVTQFNAVSYRVISSILVEPRLKPPERAQIIATWIDIAQELRLLKNFSSLKAIISGLQSNPVYRLTKTWAALPREKMEIFNELARIFSEDNNAWVQREVLMREGTAKFADTVGENDRHLQKAFQKQSMHTSYGTIPYLGTFLTDLTMIHAAIPDITENLINFDKKRKEFEVLAQIQLLQGAANAYQLHEDHDFDRWFASVLVLDEREAHTISCQLEPPTEPRRSQSSGHRKTDSMTSNSSSGAGSQFYCDIIQNGVSRPSSRHNSLDRDATPPNPSMLSASSSVSNLSLESSTSSGQKFQNNGKHHIANGKSHQNGSVPIINAQLVKTATTGKNSAPDFYIIRVTYETDHRELDGIVLYKSIMLGNNERTPQVIRNAMMKLGLDSDPDKWTLAQVLPDKELVMPANANVYYAVNTTYNLNFILRPKRDGQ